MLTFQLCLKMGDIIWVLKEPVHSSLFWQYFQIKAFPSCNHRVNHCHESADQDWWLFEAYWRPWRYILLQVKTVSITQVDNFQLGLKRTFIAKSHVLQADWWKPRIGGTKRSNLPTSVVILTSIFALMPKVPVFKCQKMALQAHKSSNGLQKPRETPPKMVG